MDDRTKVCSKCQLPKPVGDFHRRLESPDGLQAYCKTCKHDDPTRNLRQRRWQLKQYGLTQEQYDQMLADQDGKCAICGKVEALSVDHDHDTGEVRGLLCNNCNPGLGKFQDSAPLLREAACYLQPIGSDEHLMGLIMGTV